MAIRTDFTAGEVLAAADLNDTFGSKGDISSNGAWNTYTPSLTNITLGNGTLVGRYLLIGKQCTVAVLFQLGSTSVFTGSIGFGLPFARSGTGFRMVGLAYGEDSGVAGYRFDIRLAASTVNVLTSDGLAITGNTNATNPFTWANGDFLNLLFTYEID